MTEQTILLIIYCGLVGCAWYTTSQIQALKDMPQARWLSFVFVLPAMAVAVGEWGVPGLLVGLLGFAIVYGGLSLLNSGNTEGGTEQHLRGAELLDARDKNFLLKKKQAAESKHGRIFTTVGGVCIAIKNEVRNFLFIGMQGKGKSQAFHEVIQSVLARKEKAIIFDESGDFLTKHGRDNDLIFSMGDRRSLDWSLMNEVRRREDCALLSAAIIPKGKSSQEEQWNGYGRDLLQVILEKVFEAGRKENGLIYDLVMTAKMEKLKEMSQGTIAQRLFEDGAEKMLASAVAVLGSNFKTLRDFPDGSFSIRDYIQNEDKYKNDVLYMVTDSNRIIAYAPIYRAMLNLAFSYANALPPDDDRRLWFFIDELPVLESLHGVDSLLNRGRKRGATLVCGIQSTAYLDEMYGREKTPLMMNGFGTLLVLGTGDEVSAKAAAAQLGAHDVMRAVNSESEGSSGTGSSSNKSTNYNVVPDVKLVTASELASLPDLTGYLRRSGDNYPVLLVNIPICYKKGTHPAYLEPRSPEEISLEQDRIEALEDEKWRIEFDKSEALEREKEQLAIGSQLIDLYHHSKIFSEQSSAVDSSDDASYPIDFKHHSKSESKHGKDQKLEIGVAVAAAASQMLTPDFERSIADILAFEEQQKTPIVIGQTVHPEHHKEVTHEVIIEREIDHQSSIDQDDSHGSTYTDNQSES